jgi:ribosomal protein RSM22 (predicted rRNA methylase)
MITLPEALSQAVEAELRQHDPIAIRNAAEALSQSYRGKTAIARALSPVERAAYLAVRFPSTFAAASVVWNQVEQVLDLSGVETVLDVGAGPGTASLAAADTLGGARFLQAERDAGWRSIAERLAEAAGLRTAFQMTTLPQRFAQHDVVVAAYALNELAANELSHAVSELWNTARKALIVVEPGTPKGFAVAETVRSQALAGGGHAAAPCTHNDTCPMTAKDWCHQPVRVARSSSHRAAKLGALPFEDEKFSYIIVTREPPRRIAPARIVRKPIRNAGHVHLDLCTAGTLQRVTVARSDKGLYRDARDAAWGDHWPPR